MRQEDLKTWLRAILATTRGPFIAMQEMRNTSGTARNAVQAVQLLVEAVKDPRTALPILPVGVPHVDELASVQVRGSEQGC